METSAFREVAQPTPAAEKPAIGREMLSRLGKVIPPPSLRLTLMAQGIYYAVAGLWSLVAIDSFMAITGPKEDVWLVHTVGVLVLAIGAVLFCAGFGRRPPWELVLLALTSALGLACIDFVYVIRQIIPPIYLADAAIECVLVVLVLRGLYAQRSRHPSDRRIDT